MRPTFHNLYVRRVSQYQRDIRGGPNAGGMNRTCYRYEMVDSEGKKYVYSGVYLSGVTEGSMIDLQAAIKVKRDNYGYCRLARPKLIQSEGEGML